MPDYISGRMRRWKAQGMGFRLVLAFTLTFGVLALLVFATWRSATQLIQDARWVDHSNDVIGELAEMLSALKDAETGQRGYLLTGDVEFLHPFVDGVPVVEKRVRRIAALVLDDPEQSARSKDLRRLTEQRLEQLERAVQLAKAGRREEAISSTREGSGKATMDTIRNLVAGMDQQERSILASREGRTKESIQTVVGTLSVGALLLFCFLFLTWYLIRTDLAQRDLAEAAIREREGRIRRLVDANIVGVLFSDSEGVSEANDAFLSIVGFERDAWRPREHRLFEFTAPEFAELDETCDAELLSKGTCPPYQKELIRRDGTRVAVLFGATVVDVEAAKPVRASFVVDLSELKRIEAERNRLYEEARDAVKARDAFLSVAGHEIRTPLSALSLLVYQLARHVRKLGDDKSVGLVGRCEKQVARLVRLTDELLDVSRTASGALHLDLEETDLAGLARDVADRFEENARRAACVLTVTAEEPVIGFWDRSRLDQVVTNLVTNALKFGRGKPVDISVRTSGAEALLTVEDRGIGIHEGDQLRIFERFERAVSKMSYGGMGLGLWIAREMVEAHGGRIGVESRPGGGATFRVRLPRVDADPVSVSPG